MVAKDVKTVESLLYDDEVDEMLTLSLISYSYAKIARRSYFYPNLHGR